MMGTRPAGGTYQTVPSREVDGVGERIQISTGSRTPVYVQLADQLRYLIGTGELAPGTRLPSARHLASNLQINRNTVLNAYARLADAGLVTGRGGDGTRVRYPQHSGATNAPPLSRELLSMVDGLIDFGRNQGLSADEIGALVASHAQVRRPTQALQVCFVECNPASLEHYVGQLEREFDIAITPVLLRDFGAVYARGDLASADCVVSTFFHLSDVRRMLREGALDLELFAISVRPHLSVLERLERLARDSIVGIAYVAEDEFASERLKRMTEAVRDIGLRQIEIRPLLLPPTPPLDAQLFNGLDAVLVRPNNIAVVRQALPAGLDVIEFANELDSASRAFLAEVFEDLRARKSESACG